MSDAVDHPKHYNAHPSGVECIELVEHMTFNIGNAVKYIWRAGEKGPALEDWKKARWYLAREFHRLDTTRGVPSFGAIGDDRIRANARLSEWAMCEPYGARREAILRIAEGCFAPGSRLLSVIVSLRQAIDIADHEIIRLMGPF